MRLASAKMGASIWQQLEKTITPDTACVLIQSPNFFGNDRRCSGDC